MRSPVYFTRRRPRFLNHDEDGVAFVARNFGAQRRMTNGEGGGSHSFVLLIVLEIARDTKRRLQEGEFLHLDVPSHDVYPIWGVGQINLVGVLVGYNGARHLLRHLRHHYDVVHLLPRDSTGWLVFSGIKRAFRP